MIKERNRKFLELLSFIQPEGVEQTYSRSSFIAGEGTETLTLDVPDPIVPESFHGVISLSGRTCSAALFAKALVCVFALQVM